MAVRIMLESFIATQKFSVMRSMRKVPHWSTPYCTGRYQTVPAGTVCAYPGTAITLGWLCAVGIEPFTVSLLPSRWLSLYYTCSPHRLISHLVLHVLTTSTHLVLHVLTTSTHLSPCITRAHHIDSPCITHAHHIDSSLTLYYTCSPHRLISHLVLHVLTTLTHISPCITRAHHIDSPCITCAHHTDSSLTLYYMCSPHRLISHLVLHVLTTSTHLVLHVLTTSTHLSPCITRAHHIDSPCITRAHHIDSSLTLYYMCSPH